MNQYRKTMNQQSLTQESHTVPCERGDTMSKWKVACIGVIALTHLYGLLYMISKSLDTSSLATNSPAGDTTMQARAASCLQDPVEKYTPHQYLMCTTMWQPECSLPYDHSWDFHKFSLGFECQRDNWCDTYYNKQETIDVQTYIFKLQHPQTCDRLLVVSDEYWWGLGADLHTKSQTMGISIAENRTTLIGRPGWTWANIGICNIDRNSTDCWFQPYSSCSSENMTNWSQFPVWTEFNSTNADLMQLEMGTFLNENIFSRSTYVPPQYAHKDVLWWHAQITKYLTRPNARTISLVETKQKKIFGGDGSLPHPIISLYVRHGDKWKEAQPKTLKDYMDPVMGVADKHNISHLYIGTDDQEIIDEIKQDYGSRFRIYYIDTPRSTGNHTEKSPMDMMKENPEIMRVSLIDLYLQIQGDVFVGTRSSNWCRLIDELRKTNGKARVPYYSPEDVYSYD